MNAPPDDVVADDDESARPFCNGVIVRDLARRHGTRALAILGAAKKRADLGEDFGHQREYSEDTARLVDIEVKSLLTNAYRRAESIISTNLDALHKMAAALLERSAVAPRGCRSSTARS